MIVFDLKCESSHQFESWFRSSSDYSEQLERGLITCPICNSAKVTKALMAPNVAAKSNQKTQVAVREPDMTKRSLPAEASLVSAGQAQVAKPFSATSGLENGPSATELKELQEKIAEVATAVRTYVEKNCEDVGDKFAEEARKIHYGETEARGIYGNATRDEAVELLDEGIELMPLPGAKRLDA